MTDACLRELERRWKDTGLVEDEAEYLRARVRAGDLALERLELAAYCGHPAAQRLAPGGVATLPLTDWSLGFELFGDALCVRVAAGALQLLRRDALHEAVADAVDDWLACAAPHPVLDRLEDEPHRERARCACWAASETLMRSSLELEHRNRAWLTGPPPAEPRRDDPRCRDLSVLCLAQGVALRRFPAWVMQRNADPADGRHFLAQALPLAAAVAGEGPLREAVRAELLPWVLEGRDPASARLVARSGRRSAP